ncbi:hypothetical protein Mgra_00004785 [Meloidogyne graminicola]|uniref:Pyrroline-5-carboxylate reductase n=1 Tax=Meloidogyne graminicola TaxID=189291 RepID=A0A8S9ZRQ4_9BILA|nr:hypothetical protein Mgra_00004785 [Meloidogyne graminicola]
MKIGFIGAGKMAQALARGLINSGRYPSQNLMASCPKTDAGLLEDCKKLGINTTHDNSQIAKENDVVILAVKPTIVSKVASGMNYKNEIAPSIRRDHLLISIALGITIRYIEQLLPSKSRIVRVMPNTPVVVGAGASAYSMGSACQDGDSQIVQDLFSTVGYAVELPEIHIDPVTGLSGSGPSYGFAIIEGLSDGGVKMGLPRDLSTKLAAMTLYGAAKMFLETGEHPAILKEAIQSPSGSTIYGMHELEKGGLRGLLINAVEAGSERSRHMGQTSLPHSRTKIKSRKELQNEEEEEEFINDETCSESEVENNGDEEEDENNEHKDCIKRKNKKDF